MHNLSISDSKKQMRPINHPDISEISVEGILYALSDPVRVQIFMSLAQAGCSKNCSTFIYQGEKPLPKSTLSQHFRILREAGLVRSERSGVELHNTSRCAELKGRFGPMIEGIIKAYQAQKNSSKVKKKSR